MPTIAAYIKNKIRVDVSLASHTHQVPQLGFPHIAPLIKAIKVKEAPIGAADLNSIPATLALQIRQIPPVIAISINIDWDRIADGT